MGTLVILFVVDKMIGLRVSEDDERDGLDLSQHGEEGLRLGALDQRWALSCERLRKAKGRCRRLKR